MAGVFFCFFALSITGCDNGDSYEARLEDARIALDDGDYALARSILDSLPQTEEVLQYKSNAIAGGELNLDTLNIIVTMEELDDEGDAGSIDMVGKIVAGDDDQLTGDEIDSKLAAADEAIGIFEDIAAMKGTTTKGTADLSDNQKLQLGLLSIVRIVLTLADLICDEINGEPVTMTEAWIRDNYTDFQDISPTQEQLDRINLDLDYIELTIDIFADSNDLKDDFENFMNDIDGNGDGTVSTAELNAYLAEM